MGGAHAVVVVAWREGGNLFKHMRIARQKHPQVFVRAALCQFVGVDVVLARIVAELLEHARVGVACDEGQAEGLAVGAVIHHPPRGHVIVGNRADARYRHRSRADLHRVPSGQLMHVRIAFLQHSLVIGDGKAPIVQDGKVYGLAHAHDAQSAPVLFVDVEVERPLEVLAMPFDRLFLCRGQRGCRLELPILIIGGKVVLLASDRVRVRNRRKRRCHVHAHGHEQAHQEICACVLPQVDGYGL